MKKQKKSKSSKIIIFICFALTVWLSYTLVNLNKTYQTLEVNNENVIKLLEKERAREKELSSDYSKIGDPAYLTAYAREQLLYSENGTIVINLPQEEE